MISVVMASYNHAPYLRESVDSVLSQTEEDLELLIADDGSSDGSGEILASIRDKRVSVVVHPRNRGAAVVTNELIARCNGEYIALINSDDVWESDKLRAQMVVLREMENVGLVFARPTFITESGERCSEDRVPGGGVFRQKNRRRGEWLRHFYEFGNCLCHPTVLARREVYEALGAYNGAFRQLPDFDMWIRAAKKFELFVLDEELIRFRYLPGKNASSQHSENSVRTMNEHFLIGCSFFSDFSMPLLSEGFSDIVSERAFESQKHLEIECALLLFRPVRWFQEVYNVAGMLNVLKLYSCPSVRNIMQNEYGIDDKWLHQRFARVETFRMSDGGIDRLSRYRSSDLLRELRRRAALWLGASGRRRRV